MVSRGSATSLSSSLQVQLAYRAKFVKLVSGSLQLTTNSIDIIQKYHLFVWNLTRPEAQSQVLSMVSHLKPMSIHLGLPCGTCSRARERALPSNLKRAIFEHRNSYGIIQTFSASIGSKAQTDFKVENANELYRFAVQILFLCPQLNIIPSIENPTRSWLWGVLALLVLEKGDRLLHVGSENLCKTTFHAACTDLRETSRHRC